MSTDIYKHTPGPWTVLEGRHNASNEPVTFSVSGPPCAFMYLESGHDSALIAAAPDLLKERDELRAKLKEMTRERDQAVTNANARDKKWQDGIDAVMGPLDWTDMTAPPWRSFDGVYGRLKKRLEASEKQCAAMREAAQKYKDKYESARGVPGKETCEFIHFLLSTDAGKDYIHKDEAEIAAQKAIGEIFSTPFEVVDEEGVLICMVYHKCDSGDEAEGIMPADWFEGRMFGNYVPISQLDASEQSRLQMREALEQIRSSCELLKATYKLNPKSVLFVEVPQSINEIAETALSTPAPSDWIKRESVQGLVALLQSSREALNAAYDEGTADASFDRVSSKNAVEIKEEWEAKRNAALAAWKETK